MCPARRVQDLPDRPDGILAPQSVPAVVGFQRKFAQGRFTGYSDAGEVCLAIANVVAQMRRRDRQSLRKQYLYLQR